MGAIGDRRARPTLEESLHATEEGIALAAAQALGRLGDKGAVGQLATMVRESKDVQLQSLSMLSIGRLGGRQAEAVLKELRPVKGDEENLHAAWAIAAGMSGHDGAYQELVATLLHGTDDRKHSDNKSPRRDEENLRGAAAVALGLYGAPGGKSQIEKVLEMKNVRPTFRAYLTTGLGLLGTDAADELLLELVKQEKLTPEERRGIAAGLGLANSEKTSVALVKMLLEEDREGTLADIALGGFPCLNHLAIYGCPAPARRRSADRVARAESTGTGRTPCARPWIPRRYPQRRYHLQHARWHGLSP